MSSYKREKRDRSRERRSRSRSRERRRSRRSRSRSRSPRQRSRSRSRSRSREVKREKIKKEPTGPVSEPVVPKKVDLQMQKELLKRKKEELLKAKAAEVKAEMPAVPLLPSLAAKQGEGPMPLMLDEQGRQVDAQGQVVSVFASKASSNKSLMINKRVEREKAFGSRKEEKEAAGAVSKAQIDPRLGQAAPAKREKKKAFRFLEPGTIVRKADRVRAEQKMDALNQQLAASGQDVTPEVAAAALEAKADIDLTPASWEERETVPEFEWWDLVLVNPEQQEGSEGWFQPKSYAELEARALAGVNAMLEHPKLVASVKGPAKETVIPLMLTDKERKRMRREEREAKQETMRAQITLGIIPPPPPKVKLSNMERVFGAKMVENPTAVEAEVRKAMQARLMKHLIANEERKLTPTEKREKKIKAIMADRKEELQAAVFRIDDLSNRRLLWKVQTNAKQAHCTGVLVTYPQLNVLVVEGGPKAVKFMKKLMLRRIDWNEKNDEPEGGVEEDFADKRTLSTGPNKCVMAWQGVIARPAFQSFNVVHSDGDLIVAREQFESAKVLQYWDLARSMVVDDSMTLVQRAEL